MLIAAVEDNHLLRQWPPTSLELKLFDRQLYHLRTKKKPQRFDMSKKLCYVQKKHGETLYTTILRSLDLSPFPAIFELSKCIFSQGQKLQSWEFKKDVC